jgi:uncharacterized protein YuzE
VVYAVVAQDRGDHGLPGGGKTAMKGTYDRQADALYIRVAREDIAIARTVARTDDLMLDYDADGRLVGVEVLGVSDVSDLRAVLQPFGIDPGQVEITLIGAPPEGLPATR